MKPLSDLLKVTQEMSEVQNPVPTAKKQTKQQ